MDELWNVLVPTFEDNPDLNDVEIKSFPWTLFPNLFKQKADNSFYVNSDELA
jgi:hypothetical protein